MAFAADSCGAVDLGSLCTDVAAYIAVPIRVDTCDVTVTSTPVRPSAQQDPRKLIKERQCCPRYVLLCGDFNAHSKRWDDGRTSTYGEARYHITEELRLVVLNDRSATFIQEGERGSMLDLTFGSPEVYSHDLRSLEYDSWGSGMIRGAAIISQYACFLFYLKLVNVTPIE